MNIDIDAQFPEKLKPLFKPKRYKILHGGRGGCKSWGIARALLILGMKQPRRYLCAREFQKSIKDSVHRLIKEQIGLLDLRWFYTVYETEIRGKNGTVFGFEGLKMNINNIRSYEGADICWVEEAHTVSNDSWEVLIPTIRKDSSEIWMSFNPEFEDDPTFERFIKDPPENSVVIEIGYKDNPWFPDVLDEERLELKRKDPDAYDHVWGGKCRKWVAGAIYANELRAVYEEERVRDVPHDPEAKVYTAWDIGHTDDTAIWWYQVIGGEIHILESYAATAGSPSDFLSQILGKKVKVVLTDEIKIEIGKDIEELKHRQQYVYETHWLPHDARARMFVSGGKTVESIFRAALMGDQNKGKKDKEGNALPELHAYVGITTNISVELGIQAARVTFPKCYFDKVKCVTGLKALRKYQREVQTDNVSLKKIPKHDWTSHYSDAFRYLALSWDAPRIIQAEALEVIVNDPYGFGDDEVDGWKTA